MSKKSLVALGIVCVGLFLVAPTLSAQEIKASGTNMFVPKVVETFSLADGSVATRVFFPGFITADDPSNPLRQASMTCAGTSITTKDGKPIRSAGTCDSVDAQGDVAFYWWRADEKNGGRWGFLGGTGKWTNVEGGGTYDPSFHWKDGREANTWKGAWKTK